MSAATYQELLEPAPLAMRLAPALVDLGLRGVISWNEARFVLNAVEHFDELAARRDRALWLLLGGKVAS